MSRKYRVEQKFTTGWGVVDERAIKLSKDEAKKVLENLLACLLYTSDAADDS